MQLDVFLQRLSAVPETIAFADTIAVIEAHYDFTPTEFRNGDLLNAAGQNNGSCKIFSFARLQHLTEQQALHCFGAYYRDDVLQHPEATDHQNIRNFMRSGWAGVVFTGEALKPKLYSSRRLT
ncbi:MAG: HopJ type III effector protein [Nitrosomonadales bacterium]|nr:HopJ type III effector protein [Nitrosomonadales bacterium]